MNPVLPRVTYSNIGADFAPLHAWLDSEIPAFETTGLGRSWQTFFASEPLQPQFSPIDGSLLLGQFPGSSADDVDRAVDASRAGARQWNQASLDERLDFAWRWQQELEAAKYPLALAALYEVGKSRLESVGEAEEAVDMVAYYRSELQANKGFVRPMQQMIEHETATSVLRPYGVFAVIAPFNFPLALAVGMMSGALLSGNAVVFKPAPQSALTGLMLAETLARAGLPKGVFNLVLGGDAVGEQLSTHAGIDGVAFTGSHAVGMRILRHMAGLPWMKPVIAEMGGKNPSYVTRHADIERAAQGVARSAFGLQGQKCSAGSVVYVDRAVRDEFVAALLDFSNGLAVGDVRRAETYMGPVYNEAAMQRFARSVELGRASGQLLMGGGRVDAGLQGHYVQPTLIELPAPGPLTRDELFLPLLALRTVDGLDAALAEGNDVAYGLTAGIYTRNEAELQQFLGQAQAGVLYANRASGATTGAWPGGQPFCGWKGTGVGGKGGLGAYYLPQFMREQSRTVMTV